MMDSRYKKDGIGIFVRKGNAYPEPFVASPEFGVLNLQKPEITPVVGLYYGSTGRGWGSIKFHYVDLKTGSTFRMENGQVVEIESVSWRTKDEQDEIELYF